MSTTVTTPEVAKDEQLEKVAAWAKEKKIDTGEPVAAPPPPPANARPLGELVRSPQGDPNELLRYRYLCRGGGLLLVGPTGIGKSSLSMQFIGEKGEGYYSRKSENKDRQQLQSSSEHGSPSGIV